MPISRSSDFTNDFPPLTAAEAKKFYLFRCGNGRCECESDTAVWIIADCREGCHRRDGNRLWRQCNSGTTYGKAIVIQLLVKIEPWRTMDSAKYVRPLKSWTALFQRMREASRSPLHAWEIVVKRARTFALYWLAGWLGLTLVLK